MNSGRLTRAEPRKQTPVVLHAVAVNVAHLGPAPAKILWTQGCALGCTGCLSPETFSLAGGAWALPSDVVDWLVASPGTNLTVSGGEPTDQALALIEVFDLLGPAWIITVYSGHTLEELRKDARPGIVDLLARTDVLIDGRYRIEEHADLLWRASRNQRVHDMSGRAVIPEEDRSAGVTVRITNNGLVETIGVPPRPGYIGALREAAVKHCIALGPAGDLSVRLPFPTMEA